LTGAAALFEEDDGRLAALLPFALGNDDATVSAEGHLVEEAPDSEFTIASYNVENLFDQIDESHNATYGDYRITPNQSGQTSNYGQPVQFEGATTSFTGVKIAGIRKALLGLAPQGPEVVGLIEIESQAALDALLDAVKDLGYVAAEFTTWAPGDKQNPIGCGLLSKFPVKAKSMLTVPRGESDSESGRPIVRVELDVHGHPLVAYVNHWKSKGGPESRRILYAEALRRDLDALLAERPAADYVIMGDLNSEYNERLILQARHDDTSGTTGINDVLKAQGDELAVRAGTDLSLTYNLHYELDRAARRTAWHMGFDWSSLDHMIVGSGVYDQRGITYVDNSFQPAHAGMPDLAFLFNADGTTKRWRQVRESATQTRHEVGGYSDHAPIAARFLIQRHQSNAKIRLFKPGVPDQTDGT
jgi:endonuclease/exonuclease/phosphatase family metal-dependent hydrolase